MRLIYRITLGLVATLVPIIALWATLFYYAMTVEINDEADESLQDYAALIIERCREGRVLPSLNSGSNNRYTIEPVDRSEFEAYDGEQYCDREVYVPETGETEQVRLLTKMFDDGAGHYLRLEVSMPTFEKEDLRETILSWVITLFGLLLLIVVVVSLLIFRRAMRPLYILLRWLDSYVPGSGAVSVAINTSIKEFCKLNDSVEGAVNRSEELLDRQKQFLANASHELMTPLAVIGNRVEYIINGTEVSEEQLTELVKIQQSLRHSVRLNRTLLMLMRIESGQVEDSCDVDIAEIVGNVTESLADIYEERGMECRVSGVQHLSVHMSEALARTLVTNLIKNAYVHGVEHGHIDVVLSERLLSVSNTGVEPLDATRIFNRFYTHTSREGSTGLGLTIIRSITQHYGFDVRYDYCESESRHIFTIRF